MGTRLKAICLPRSLQLIDTDLFLMLCIRDNKAFPNGDELDELDAAALADVLKYHVVGEKIMAADLTNGMQLVTLQGANITVSVSAGVTLNAGSTNPATVVTADIQASNGVIHAISDYLVAPV